MKTRTPKFLTRLAAGNAAVTDLLESGIIRDSPTIRAEKQPDGRYQLRLNTSPGAGTSPSILRPIKKWRKSIGAAPRFLGVAKAGITTVTDIIRTGLVVDSEHVWVEGLPDGSVRLHVRPGFMGLAFGIAGQQSVILMEFGGDILMEFGGSILME